MVASVHGAVAAGPAGPAAVVARRMGTAHSVSEAPGGRSIRAHPGRPLSALMAHITWAEYCLLQPDAMFHAITQGT
ncbi:hypothetical protein BKK79_05060 [Cupriavidus sp. USMAA2-4]|nr:hypothetical protein BKK79_05060 [Cupriavidus sp. USMAA2-4]